MWINKDIEYHIGDEPVLFIAPHRGEMKVEVKDLEGNLRKLHLGEVGTGHLVKLAAREVNGSYLVVHVPRLKADFARDPKFLGKGEKFRQNLQGKKIWFESHKDTNYAGLLKKFHDLIKKINPDFIIDIHNMGSRKVDAKLGFGRDRRYINGSDNALKFRDELLKRLEKPLEVLVSKVELTGESEYILNKYEKNRLAMLIELSRPRGLDEEKGVYKPEFQELIRQAALLALEWTKAESLQ